MNRELRATNRSAVKYLALLYAKDTRAHRFTRVSADFLDEIETQVRRMIRQRVDSHPSKGVTLT